MTKKRTALGLLRSRDPIGTIIARQRKRLVTLDERIGRLMTERADEEEILADLYRQLTPSQRANLGLPIAPKDPE